MRRHKQTSLGLSRLFGRGFTIVELVVVIGVIGILAAVSVVGYGAWRTNILAAQVKSDLNGAAAAMEDARNFDGLYAANILDAFIPSDGVILSGGSEDGGTSYCIDGTSQDNNTIAFYIDPTVKGSGAAEGTCASRPNTDVPMTPSGLALSGITLNSISMDWTPVSQVDLYEFQCALDGAYIVGVKSVTSPSQNATINDLENETLYYCHVRATNNLGNSGWSSTVAVSTREPVCADTNQLGNYPNCYDYDSLPIASSIEGYWTTAPDGYLLENGAAVSRTTYADLFAAIGTSFGAGDGSTTFNLPDSRGRTAVNLNPADTEFDVIGEMPGSNTEQLTVAQIPSHTHLVPWQTVNDVSDYLGGSTASYGLASSWASRQGSYQMLEPVGGGGTHNNIQPSIVKVFAIKFRPSSGAESTLPAGTSVQGYWSAAPSGYLLENGAEVSRTTYADLFSVMGTTHGAGNGSTTFNIPDSRGRVAVNQSPTDPEFDTMGEKTGSKTETLTIAQMPTHTHRVPWVGSGDPSDYLGGSYAPYGLAYSYSIRQGVYNMLEPVGGGAPHNNIQRSIVKTFAVKHTPAAGTAVASPVGTSIQGYWSTAPTGYLLENGAEVSRTTYADLFSVIGTTYGAGNGSTTFNVPDSRGRVGVNMSPLYAEFDAMNDKSGTKTVTLTIAQMPSHRHQVPWIGSGDVSDYLGGSTASFGMNSGYGAANTYDMLEPVGGGGAHNNIQPSIVKMFAIKH